MTPANRYKGMNGACTHIGNTDFCLMVRSPPVATMSRLNFLALLLINDEALMRGRSLSGLVIARLAGQPFVFAHSISERTLRPCR